MKSQSGFTLMELLAVVTIAAVLAALAAPSFRYMVRDNRITASTNTLISHLALARSEAITRRTPVVMCRSFEPFAQCDPPEGTPNVWSDGWLLFADADGSLNFSAGDVLIKIGEATAGDLQMISNADAEPQIEYDIDGSSTVAIGNVASFAVCDPRGEEFGRQIDIDELGRLELIKADVADPLVSCTAP